MFMVMDRSSISFFCVNLKHMHCYVCSYRSYNKILTNCIVSDQPKVGSHFFLLLDCLVFSAYINPFMFLLFQMEWNSFRAVMIVYIVQLKV